MTKRSKASKGRKTHCQTPLDHRWTGTKAPLERQSDTVGDLGDAASCLEPLDRR